MNNLKSVFEEYLAEGLSKERIITKLVDAVLDSIPDHELKELLRPKIKAALINNYDGLVEGTIDLDAVLEPVAEETARAYAAEKASPYIKDKTKTFVLNVYGKASGKKRGRLSNNTKDVTEDVAVAASDNITELIKGNQSIDEAIENTGKDVLREQTEKHLKDAVTSGSRKAYRKVTGKTGGGRYSNATNRNIDSVASSVVENTFAVINGEKDVGDAVVDTAVGSSKEIAKGYGKELAIKGIEIIQKEALKRVKNETARGLIKSGLGKLATNNGVTAFAGCAIEIGSAIKRYAEGEITEAELLTLMSKEGTAAVVSSVCGTIGGTLGTAIAGPLGTVVGGAVGSMIGYVASNMLYGAVLTAFSDVDRAREHYLMVKEMCEEARRQMRVERAAFEKQAAELFENRAKVVTAVFDKLDRSVDNNNVEEMTQGLDMLVKEFGGELQFKSVDEFEAFMLDENSGDLIL